MADELSSLILQLSMYQPVGTKPKPLALGFVLNYPRFISTLNKINSMIGLKNVKNQIANQIKFFIVNYRISQKPTHGEMLHTLIYGPSGCGKTQLGKYLAELWSVSGCLPKSNSKSVEERSPKVVINPNGIISINDPEKNILKTNLALREAQIKQDQNKIQSLQTNAGETLTLLNNVRKKIKSRNPEQEAQIQAKFQEIKRHLREISGKPLNSNSPIGFQILPVTVPRIPGDRSRFGQPQSSPLPSLPSLPTLPNLPGNTNKLPESSETPEEEVKFVVLTRGDIVGKFQGHTTAKIKEIFSKYEGGVVFIDEAYGLITGSNDDFGREGLTEIINYMSTYPDKIIFIFAGYRQEMEESVLKFQPGLSRRFNWTFEIENYSSDELSQIFNQQLSKKNKGVNENTSEKVKKFFEENISEFPHFGGDTENFVSFVNETCYEEHWISALDDEISVQTYEQLFTNISFEMIEKSYQKYLNNSIHHRNQAKNKMELHIKNSLYS